MIVVLFLVILWLYVAMLWWWNDPNKQSAMDATIEFAKQKTGNTIKKFVVAGASKRGWVTWLTSAVDKRVMAQVSWRSCSCLVWSVSVVCNDVCEN
jgi:hypothetical protein